MRVLVRLAAVAGLLSAWTGAALVQPSWACGCGAFVGSGGESGIDVADETSIVRFDDQAGTEQIVMRLSVTSQARDAGWLFPTPSAAQVRLGDRAWFQELDKLTEPRVVRRRTWFPRFGLAAPTRPVRRRAAPVASPCSARSTSGPSRWRRWPRTTRRRSRRG
jgi:hypothetical protein